MPSGEHLAENKLFWNSRQWFQVERNFLGRLQFCTFEITFFEVVWNEDTPFSAQCINTADNGVCKNGSQGAKVQTFAYSDGYFVEF